MRAPLALIDLARGERELVRRAEAALAPGLRDTLRAEVFLRAVVLRAVVLRALVLRAALARGLLGFAEVGVAVGIFAPNPG